MLPFDIPNDIQLPIDLSSLKDKALFSLDAFIPEFLRERFRLGSVNAPILKTPLDVFVDEIFIYLTVEDVLSLRQVNKGFHLLSFEPIIWRRFLERLDFPVPPLMPTFRYSLAITDFEIEQLVIQSITVDDNWRHPNPKVYNIQSVFALDRVNDLFLLPGGRYLVASVNDTEFHRFYLVVFMLDHPNGPRAMARIPTFSKAYNIQAKYVRIRDYENGLVITYVRRRFKYVQSKGQNASRYSHEHHIDVPGGFSYQAVTVYANLDLLEYLKSPDLAPKTAPYKEITNSLPSPFEELAIAATPYEITQTSIFKRHGRCFTAMIIEPAELHIFNVLNRKEHTIVAFKPWLNHEAFPHRIRAFRLYPDQNDMIVIRTVCPAPGKEFHLIEWYELPLYNGIVQVGAKSRYTIKDKKVRKFHISDYGNPNKIKLENDHPTLRHVRGAPPPVSIFLEREDPYGVEHHAIYAQQIYVGATAAEPAHFKYVFGHDSYQMSSHICAPHRAKVLAGSSRALVCILQGDDRTETPKMVSIRRYVHPKNAGINYLPDPPPEVRSDGVPVAPEHELPVLRKNSRLKVPRLGIFATLESGDLIEEMNKEGGLRAIAWDEATGRICMASEDKEIIRIVDCARTSVPDARSEAWKRRRDMLRDRGILGV